jgi:hypothetical protein
VLALPLSFIDRARSGEAAQATSPAVAVFELDRGEAAELERNRDAVMA